MVLGCRQGWTGETVSEYRCLYTSVDQTARSQNNIEFLIFPPAVFSITTYFYKFNDNQKLIPLYLTLCVVNIPECWFLSRRPWVLVCVHAPDRSMTHKLAHTTHNISQGGLSLSLYEPVSDTTSELQHWTNNVQE